jgi:hypothetical protein
MESKYPPLNKHRPKTLSESWLTVSKVETLRGFFQALEGVGFDNLSRHCLLLFRFFFIGITAPVFDLRFLLFNDPFLDDCPGFLFRFALVLGVLTTASIEEG